MSNWMNNAKSWLGLGSDPYEPREDVAYDEPVRYADEDELDLHDDVRVGGGQTGGATGGGTVTPLAGRGRDWDDDDDGGVRVLEPEGGSDDGDTRGVVRPLPASGQPHLVVPDNFNDVQEVGDTFARSQPVILNLQGLDRDLSRRIIDFSSGLCYGLDGTMERVGDQVFLLTPVGTQVSEDDRRRMRDGEF